VNRAAPATPLRLWAAAALAILPLGLTWSRGFATGGYTIYGDCSYTADTYCVSDVYFPGHSQPGSLGSDVPARVFLVLAAAALVYTAVRRRTPATRRVARVGTVALAVAAALAAGAGVAATVLCCLLALVLTVPLVWHRPVLAHSPPPG
jgi:hypothetical protein